MVIELNSLLALAAGICILLFPKILNYIVAAYFIIIGVTGILNIQIS